MDHHSKTGGVAASSPWFPRLAALLISSSACGQAERNPTDGGAGTAGASQGGAATLGGAGARANGGFGGANAAGNGASAGFGANPGVGGGGTLGDPAPPCGIPASSQVPRLTNEQYDRTVRDLLGVTSLKAFEGQSPSARLTQEHDGDLTTADWNAYLHVGEAIAKQVMTTPEQRSRFIKCAFSGDGSQCLHDTIVEFGRRAFRRPLTQAELDRFQTFVTEREQITAMGSAEEVAEVILQTFLVSPSFIWRAEISEVSDTSGNFTLSPFEVASRLSYALWGSTPDDILDQGANAGQLVTKDQIRAQAERMLRDPKARDLVAAFHRAYLGFGHDWRWVVPKKDPVLFPSFTPQVYQALLDEQDLFFEEVILTGHGAFQDLFQSPIGFVNADTASIYGLDAAGFGTSLQKVVLDPVQRPGFLTRAAFLSAFAYQKSNSPSLRGDLVERQVLGLNLGPDHGSNFPAVLEGVASATIREREEALTRDASCTACHNIVDPPGFVLEAYNSIGAWQTAEADSGLPIDTVADVYFDIGSPRVTVKDPADLMQKLAASAQAKSTYARRWVSFTFGRDDNASDKCIADELALNLGQPGYALLDLFVDLTQSDAFQSRVREVP